MEPEDQEGDKKKNVRLSWVLWSPVLLALLILLGGGVAVYGFGLKNQLTRRINSFIPYPAVIVGNSSLSIGELEANLTAVRQFYESQDFSKVGGRVDFTTPNGEKRLKIKEREILNKMIEDELIVKLAKERGIFISDEAVRDNVSRKLQEYDSEEAVRNNLLRLYGWTIADFEEKIVKPSMYKDELVKIFRQEDTSAVGAREKITQAEKALIGRSDFVQVVTEFSEGNTVQNQGELGWFKKEHLSPEIADQIFALKVGERSQILESTLGFHIIEMEERKTDDSSEIVRIRQIFTRKKIFAEWLEEQIRVVRVWVLLKGYYWNQDSLFVEFRDSDMVKFEEQIREQAVGDPSVLF